MDWRWAAAGGAGAYCVATRTACSNIKRAHTDPSLSLTPDCDMLLVQYMQINRRIIPNTTTRSMHINCTKLPFADPDR